MKHQTLTVLDTHPVMLLTLMPDFSLSADWDESEMRQILDTHPEPLFFISDIRQLKMSFDELLGAVNKGSRGQDPIWHHPRMRGMYFVSDSTIVRMAAAGLNHPAFGNTKVGVFGAVEEALADIEHVLAMA